MNDCLFHVSLLMRVWTIDVSLVFVHATWVTELGTLVKPFVSQSQDQISDEKRHGNVGTQVTYWSFISM
jgi:hypothetical protein